VTPEQAKDKNLIFNGYSEYFDVTKDEVDSDNLLDKESINEDEQS